jgi:hypothetical protein
MIRLITGTSHVMEVLHTGGGKSRSRSGGGSSGGGVAGEGNTVKNLIVDGATRYNLNIPH